MDGRGEISEGLVAGLRCGDAALAELMVLLKVVCERTCSFDALDWREICGDDGDST